MSDYTLARWGIAARQYTRRRKAKPTTSVAKIIKSDAQVETLVGPQVAPPKSCGLKPKRKRASPVKIRLSAEERAELKAKAERACMSLHTFMRYLLLGTDYDPTVREQLRQANLEMTRQGTNLNQIAYLRNGGKATDAEADTMLGIIARSMLKTHKEVLAALSAGKGPTP